MSRKIITEKRSILPDHKHNSVLITKFINNLMKDGQKFLAEKIIYKSLDILERKYNLNPSDGFRIAIENVKPSVEVKPVRIGGATYQVPILVKSERGDVLAIKWIIKSAASYSKNTLYDKLAESLFDAYNKRGAAFKKREDVHKMAESNKAFAHFAQRRTSRDQRA